MSCTAGESGLLEFLAAGTLTGEERESVVSHVSDCADCRGELAALEGVARSLRELHLTPEELTAVAAGGREPPHLRECGECRHELHLLRLVDRDLRGATARPAWIPFALAASLAGLCALGAWNLQLRGLQQDLLHRAEDARSARTAAEARLAQAEAQLRETTGLRQELADLSRPAVNVAVVDLEAAGAMRGAGVPPQRVEVPAGAEAVTFIVSVAGTPQLGSYSLEVVSQDGARVWGGSGLRRSDLDTVTISSPRRLLPAGRYRFRLTGPDGQPVLREWLVIVR